MSTVRTRSLAIAFCLCVALRMSPARAGDDENAAAGAPPNTQAETTPLLAPEEALATVRATEGFRVTLFAAEPAVRQPIGMAFDTRGRLWVAENYTYAEQQTNFDLSLRDRIVVLEDGDGDGRADRRTVFWDRAQRLTSVELGFGGVWALAAPALLFIPDRDGDDSPDGEPEVMLDGWDDRAARHNFVNGLRWGPDGWLYGRSGILATSLVGRPGTPAAERVPINCGIWRFHPVRRDFEVVCRGTTNSWGHDWDAHGQLFFINTVIGHLWHAVPGAHFERMYGEDFNPHLYALIPQTADHYHWDTAEHWSHQRTHGLTESSNRAGGGHAHSGLMVYLGDDWPAEYRGDVFALNFHGRRVNRDRVEREGATYAGRHRPDLLTVGDPWFRGIDLAYGPDGGVTILDWSDIGECHENDGVHRTTGRIYKVTHGEPTRPVARDVARLDDAALVRLQLHSNEWFARQARRVLQERAAAGRDLSAAARGLRRLLDDEDDVPHRLRALWCLDAIGALDEESLRRRLRDPSEHVRTWAVKLLAERGDPPAAVAPTLAVHAARETSGLVLTFLASALQRLDLADRWPIADRLVARGELAADRVLPLMVWYGVEPAVPADPERAVTLLERARMPLVRRFVARRLTHEIGARPGAVARLVETLAPPAGGDGEDSDGDRDRTLDVLTGMSEALRGVRKAPPPAGWQRAASALARDPRPEVRQLVRELAVVFGDGRAVDEIRALAADERQEPPVRRRAIETLVEARVEGLGELLAGLLLERDLSAAAVRGLAAVGEDGAPAVILERYGRMERPGRDAAVEALASRPAWARSLLGAVRRGPVQRKDVPAFLLRQIQLFGDAALNEEIAELLPELRLLSSEAIERIAAYRARLTPERIAAADLARGRELFAESCGTCHRLFGEGETIAPELTGAQRDNLDYWLENLLDPSATVAESFTMSLVMLKDGRILNGVVGEKTDLTLAVQTPTERVVLPRADIRRIDPTDLSLMPEGLLDLLAEDDVRDLVGYLMAAGPPAGAAPSE